MLIKADSILKEEESGDVSQTRSGIPELSGSSGQQKAPQTKTGAGQEDSAKEGLRKMNDRVASLVMKRKAELEQGIQDSPTRQQLTLVKSINDQFNFITKISEDLLKVVSRWT